MGNSGIQYPVSLEFSGAQDNGKMASLSIRDIFVIDRSIKPWDVAHSDGELPEENLYLQGIARATYEKPDGTWVEIPDFPAQILVLHWSISEVRGLVISEHGQGYFIAGHMPCSSKPRAISPAELDKLGSLPSKDMPSQEEAYREMMKFPKQCSH